MHHGAARNAQNDNIHASVRSDKHLTGAGFAPAATWLDFGPHAADLLVIPDASTLLQVPREIVFYEESAKSLVYLGTILRIMRCFGTWPCILERYLSALSWPL